MELSEEKLEWRAVKAVFRQYRECKELIKRPSSPTTGYQLGFDFGEASPKIVGDYVLQQREAAGYIAAVDAVIRQLTAAERKIITLSYLSPNRLPAWRIYEQELHVGRTLYYTEKNKAIGKCYVLLAAKGILKASPDF